MRSLLFVETHPKHLHISPSCDCRWKHIFNTFGFAISVWFICWETHTYLCISTYIRETHARIYVFLANEEATHARSFVFWSILLDILTRFQMQLLSFLHTRPASVFSRKHCVSDTFWPRDSVPAVKAFQTSCDKKELQDLKSCNVALCATAVPGSAMLSRI